MSQHVSQNSTALPTNPTHISVSCVHEYPDPLRASEAAHAVASSTGGRVYACSVFKQAGRIVITTSFPLSSIRGLLDTQSATKGTDPRTTQNRPVDTDHVANIRDYLVQNYPNYILPPLSITYREKIGVYTNEIGKVRQGFVVIPDGLFAYITDGQHRFLALVGYKGAKPELPGALSLQPRLAEDSIAVQITIEDELQRIHQDFADMAMTKPLPKSLLTAYDMRDPVNRLVYEVADNSKLFKGRVDETSKTLSKNSRQIALANWLRNFVKGSIATDYFVAEDAMFRYHDQVKDESQVVSLRDDMIFLVETMTDSIPDLKQIAAIPLSSPEASNIPALREHVLATTAVGLGIAGMVLQQIRAKISDPAKRRQAIRDIYTKVDWLKRAPGKNDSVWSDGGVFDGKAISTQRASIFRSTARIMERIGVLVDGKWKRALLKDKEDDKQIPLHSTNT